jgi:sugar phosphate isomerase/epimerase
MPRLSTSTWSLHRALGPTYWDSPAEPSREPKEPYGPGSISLLEVPTRLAEMGIHTLEICHFHLPSRDDSYLGELRNALNNAGVELYSLLIDAGDVTDPANVQRDRAWIGDWLATAGKLGARCARISGGKTVDAGAVDRCRDALTELAGVAEANGVRPMTENWQDVLATADNVLGVVEPLNGRVGLCADFGNLKGPGKYDELERILPYAETCHAKCSFTSPFVPDQTDYDRCLELAQASGFDGPYVLIYDGPDDDEWKGLALESEMIWASGAVSKNGHTA